MTHAYVSLIAAGVSTRRAAVLTAMVRSTATRRLRAATAPTPAVSALTAPAPVNKLTDLERRRVLEVLNSDRFADLAPMQIYAQLLDEGVDLCSGVHDVPGVGRAHPGHRTPPASAAPGQGVPGAGRDRAAAGVQLGHHQARGPGELEYLWAYVMIDIYSRYIVGAHVHAHRIRCAGQGTDRADLHRRRSTRGFVTGR